MGRQKNSVATSGDSRHLTNVLEAWLSPRSIKVNKLCEAGRKANSIKAFLYEPRTWRGLVGDSQSMMINLGYDDLSSYPSMFLCHVVASSTKVVLSRSRKRLSINLPPKYPNHCPQEEGLWLSEHSRYNSCSSSVGSCCFSRWRYLQLSLERNGSILFKSLLLRVLNKQRKVAHARSLWHSWVNYFSHVRLFGAFFLPTILFHRCSS